MKRLFFSICLLLLAVGCDSAVVTNTGIENQSQTINGDASQKLYLPIYNFFDDNGFVFASGTWLGKGVGYPVNVVDIHCDKIGDICSVAEGDIAGNSMLPLNVKLYTPTTWNANEILIDNGNLGSLACARVIIRLDRVAKQVTYTQVPVNSDTKFCLNPPSDQGTYNWKLGDGQDLLKAK
jgi:hypothetical protein